MDPLTQGALGAALPQATAAHGKWAASAGLFGFLAGMAADLDVLIRSSTDPLLFSNTIRQFTHSAGLHSRGRAAVRPGTAHACWGAGGVWRFARAGCFAPWGMPPMPCWMPAPPTAPCCSGPSAMSASRGIPFPSSIPVHPAAVAGGGAGGQRGRPLFARLGLLWACKVTWRWDCGSATRPNRRWAMR